MRTRPHRLWVHLSDEELDDANSKIDKTGLSKEACIRSLLNDFAPREKPDERFYEVIGDLIKIANEANNLARQINSFDSDTAWKLHNTVEKLDRLLLDIRQAYLLPEKI